MEPDEFFDLFLYDSDGPGASPVVRGPVAEWRRWWQARARTLERERPELGIALQQGFVLRTAQLPDVGVTRHAARRAVRAGEWFVPAPKTVAVVAPTTESGDHFAGERRVHALRCASAALLNPGFVVGERSAAVLAGLPTVGIPARPALIAPLEIGSHRRGKAAVGPGEVGEWFGIPRLHPARTVVDIARHDRREGIVVADAALRERVVSRAELADGALSRAVGWCGVRAARDVIALADPRSESPLESITRLALHDDGFPAPEPQMLIGEYRVDFLWREQRVVLECDGRVKYDKDQRWREKKRDLALERLGYVVVRVLWSDVVAQWPATSAYLRGRLGLG